MRGRVQKERQAIRRKVGTLRSDGEREPSVGLLKSFERGFRAQTITEANLNSALDGSEYQRARIEAFRP